MDIGTTEQSKQREVNYRVYIQVVCFMLFPTKTLAKQAVLAWNLEEILFDC